MFDDDQKSIDFFWHSFLNGDDKSFSVIYQQNISRLLLYGYKLCSDRDLVHDTIHDIFLDLFLNQRKRSKEIKNLKAYLFVSFRNSLTKKIKRQRRFEPIKKVDESENQFFNSEYKLEDQLAEFEIADDLKERLNKVVNHLPSKQKEIVYLKFEEELEYVEIAAVMKISVESSRKLMCRALLSLRKVVDIEIVQLLWFAFMKKS
ncbi:RNA polymerase sigma factor [Sunxiuqinia sp. sy24]|uniref:RNA polymerase sigma factor n=1 Tax=Sunxiuqinia sp. sy24 TaxID=3461495 RepID=UPI004045C25C